MALSNLTGWNEKSATSACGAGDKPEEKTRRLWFCLWGFGQAGRKARRLRFCLWGFGQIRSFNSNNLRRGWCSVGDTFK